MPRVLRFGISSLDELLGKMQQPTVGPSAATNPLFGIELQESGSAHPATSASATTSVCMVGPEGTGKTVFGLHLAATYLADCLAYDSSPFLDVSDLRGDGSLLRRLRNDSDGDPILRKLRGELDAELPNWRRDGEKNDDAGDLVDLLNRLLVKPGWFGELVDEPNGGVDKPNELRLLHPAESQTACGNRLLLERAFPSELIPHHELPIVIYVSTDLTGRMAQRMWGNFVLDLPYQRRDPFGVAPIEVTAGLWERRIELTPTTPEGLPDALAKIESHTPANCRVIFVDLASNTAGDNWGFLYGLISSLPMPTPSQPRHLLIVDTIEGFETIVGDLNAFGEKSTRRSRVTQLKERLTDKCHALMVVEEGKTYDNLAELFVADTVLRMENLSTRNYERRVLKVEKVRGQSHSRGQHHYSIRNGRGSTTGDQINADDPKVEVDGRTQSYVQIFHSVHLLNRNIMLIEGEPRDRSLQHKYAAFGIKYLDNLLGGTEEVPARDPDQNYDNRGLPCRSTTALIGDSLTQKTTLGKAFLSRCFSSFKDRLQEVRAQLAGYGQPDNIAGDGNIQRLLKKKLELLEEVAPQYPSQTEAASLELNFTSCDELIKYVEDRALKDDQRPYPLFSSEKGKLRYWLGLPRLLERVRTDNFNFQNYLNVHPELSGAADEVIFDAMSDPELLALIGGDRYAGELIQFLELVAFTGTRCIPGHLRETNRAEEVMASLRDTGFQLDELFDRLHAEGLVVYEEPHSAIIAEAKLTHFAAWLMGYEHGVAVMLATQNLHNTQLAQEFIHWIHPNRQELAQLNRDTKGYERAFTKYIKNGTICRRLEIHNLSSEILIHIVLQTITGAQRKILNAAEMWNTDDRFHKSWPIRLVIDDLSTFRDIFPEVHEDPLLLPSILFHFEREGITALIIDTQAGKPGTTIAERFESELRKMVQHNIYTWRVPFYGESRVAITAIPPFSYEYAGIVRELRWESEALNRTKSPLDDESGTVDPHFELYSGLEDEKPEPVPLQIRLFAGTAAMEKYIEAQNRFLGELFLPASDALHAGNSSIIVPIKDYSGLRDFAFFLHRDTRFTHSLVFGVDEFWTMREPMRRKRAGAFHPQGSYLNAITAELKGSNYQADPNVDPYELYQSRADLSLFDLNKLHRRKFYENYYRDFSGYESLGSKESPTQTQVDRVPFSWDFGFLLCHEEAWNTERRFTVGYYEENKRRYDVQQVWGVLTKAQSSVSEMWRTRLKERNETKVEANELDRLDHVSWRIFIEASKKVAERQSDRLSRPVAAFEFAQTTPESLPCLILEMWLSEIYDHLLKQNTAEARDELRRLQTTVSRRQLFTTGLERTHDRDGNRPVCLLALIQKYWLELYKSWLLLVEVLNFSEIIGDKSALDFEFQSKNSGFSAVSSRHWYKTAAQCPPDIAQNEPLVPVRLPGHFSVRGDWFLATSGSSRSIRQAEHALDLLNSRRSNVMRLQLGLGLPPRWPAGSSGVGHLRTRLTSHERSQDNVDYETFLKVGAQPGEGADSLGPTGFFWLWRSSLADYALANRVWNRWLNRTFFSWYRILLRYRSVWKNSFEVYDRLSEEPPKDKDEFAPSRATIDKARGYDPKGLTDFLEKEHKVSGIAQLVVRRNFRDLVEILEGELKQLHASSE